MTKVDYSVRGRIAMVSFQSPPVNSLGFPLRRDLLTALERAVADVRIAASFLAEARHRSVTGHETDIVAERPELGGDRFDQRRVIAAREIGAADRALEQHVADQREA